MYYNFSPVFITLGVFAVRDLRHDIKSQNRNLALLDVLLLFIYFVLATVYMILPLGVND
jgi:hypothetical protein